MPLHIDQPLLQVDSARLIVAGWIAGSGTESFALAVNGSPVACERHPRPDVGDLLPDLPFVSGLAASLELLTLPAAAEIEVSLQFGDERMKRVIAPGEWLLDRWTRDNRLRLAHREFCIRNLRCPHCTSRKSLAIRPGKISCASCKTQFRQPGPALNFLDDTTLDPVSDPASPPSSNPYTPDALDLIRRTTGAGGTVLDCGAGSRPVRSENVINLEIADYTSTDVLARGEALPFVDNCFDGVLSLAVLEHVKDPFACARELLRVVKPGGELLLDVPFLQPEHHYPGHYYNMTLEGLRNLFAGESGKNRVSEISHAVPPHGHPIFAVQWILREYQAGLSGDAARDFSAMPVDALLKLDIPEFLADPRAELAPASRQTIACLNTLHLRKA